DGIECYFPIEIPSAAPAEAEVVIEADATEEEETKTTDRTESSDRVKVIFNEHLEVLVIACYAHKKSDQRILITSIVKNPRKLTCRESKGAATACVRAIAQEAFDIYGRQASLSCIGTGRGYHFFTDIGFLSADPIAKALLDMPPLILRHFLSKSHEQSVQVLNSTLAPTL
ncbi:MAG: hypothetical protein GWP59_03355, partial [Chlamydiales bacterium]|nr:hypothetical protein [Chlamydiales bacterium]